MFELLDNGDLVLIADALKDLADGKEIRKQLVAELRDIGNPIRDRVKAAWRAAPSHGHASAARSRQAKPGLRQLLAKATHTEVLLAGKRAGVRVRTDGRRMPDGMRSLPRMAEGFTPWQHPVFARRQARGQARTVIQRPFPRFYAAVQPDVGQAQRAAEEAVARVYERIVGGRRA